MPSARCHVRRRPRCSRTPYRPLTAAPPRCPRPLAQRTTRSPRPRRPPVAGFPAALADKLSLTATTYRSVFECVDKEQLRSLAMASVGTGLAGVPLAASVRIGLQTAVDWALARARREGAGALRQTCIQFVCFEQQAYADQLAAKRQLLSAVLQPVWSEAAHEQAVAEGGPDQEGCVVS